MVKKAKGRTKLSNKDFFSSDVRGLETSNGEIDLPTAPLSKILAENPNGADQHYNRGVKIPTEPPYTAFVGNIPQGATEKDLKEFLDGLEYKNIRHMEHEARTRNFAYVEFYDRQTLTKFLTYHDKYLKDTPLKIDVAEAQKNPKSAQKMNRNYTSPRADLSADKWRASDTPSPRSFDISQSRDLENVESFRADPKKSGYRIGHNEYMSNFRRGEPDNFRREPDNFRREPDSFRREPDNFRREPDSFRREPENFRREPENFRREPENSRREPSRPKMDPFGGARPRDERNSKKETESRENQDSANLVADVKS